MPTAPFHTLRGILPYGCTSSANRLFTFGHFLRMSVVPYSSAGTPLGRARSPVPTNCACTQKGFCRILIVRRAFPKRAMEMTEYGKHGKPRNRLSMLSTLFGNPCGITTFPQPPLLAYFKMQDQERPNPRPLEHKGLVMEVPGPKCNGCSGTLTPLRGCCASS